MKKEKYRVTGMTCGACSARVEKAVKKLPGTEDVQVNLLTGSMLLKRDEGRISTEEIEKAVENAGYRARIESNGMKSVRGGTKSGRNHGDVGASQSDMNPGDEGIGSIHREEAKRKGRILMWSLLFLVPLMYFSMGPMIGHMLGHLLGIDINLPTGSELSNTFSQFILLLPIIYLNREYFVKGIPALFRGNPNMDSLIAMGSAVSTIYGIFSMYAMIYGEEGHHIYFESAGMILTLITMGKYLEAGSKGKTTDAIERLMNLTPKTVIVEREGEEVEIPVENLRAGDVMVIKPGQVIGADGIVVSGESWVEQSAITGESVPLPKKKGDEVISATLNQNGLLKVRAERVGDDSTINQIIALVNEASASKAPIAQMADKIAGVFVPTVIFIALLTFGIWMIATGDVAMAVNCGISVLVISCPCALGLATPVAIMVGTGRGAEEGILIRGGEALERLHSVDAVLMDKTGTITEGKPKVTDIVPFGISDVEFMEIAAALERGSEHPLGAAILSCQREMYSDGELPEVEDFHAYFGKGVKGKVLGRIVYGGNQSLMDEIGLNLEEDVLAKIGKFAEEGKTPMIFADDEGIIGIVAVADVAKPDSRQAIASFEKEGVEVVMLTGDNKITGEAVARKLGIDRVVAEVMPQDKEAEVRKMMNSGKTVAMIGDGINDGPALARADVGIAIGAGTDVAIESADVVLINNRLTDAFAAFKLSKAVITNIKENLFWAFIYNTILIPVAAGALYPLWGIILNPMMGAAAMSLSSFCVVMNSLRLRFFKRPEAVYLENSGSDDYNIKLKGARNFLMSSDGNVENESDEKISLSNEVEKEKDVMKYELNVKGMMCENCVKHVDKALSAMEGVKSVNVNLEKNMATVEADKEISKEEFEAVIAEAGYELV